MMPTLNAPLPSAPPEEVTPAWALPQICGPGGRRWHALLADDNVINREVGVAMLEGMGLRVDTACDGDVAVQMAKNGHYDLVLMDMQMPQLDGLAAARLLRALPTGAQMPVIAMTASAFEQDRIDCLAAGMCDLIAKPVDIKCLAAALTRWLPQRGA